MSSRDQREIRLHNVLYFAPRRLPIGEYAALNFEHCLPVGNRLREGFSTMPDKLDRVAGRIRVSPQKSANISEHLFDVRV